ncbi:lysine methyltransferase [Sinobacterium caligoides]|uniref:Lysine methyltransferase n=1 Tax=Sinobacterium caligoides TaxID=933926 RepID=A0A3N2DI34_9GAMM|nr:class I SAM-dependent methyltransferase [Sinobacterium caligoides]ROR99054.1 lysine methyltransferase [Sinobacterium caligoides]
MPQDSHTASTISEKVYDLELLSPQHPAIEQLKQQHPTSIHGDKVWDACFLLIDHFRKNPPQTGSKVLELGCGWGLAGIYLSKYYGCVVTAVDADANVFPYLQLHATVNDAKIDCQQSRFEQLEQKVLGSFDIIIAADVCFWDELSDIHQQLIDRAIAADVEQIVYADPEREPFVELAEYCAEQHCAQIELIELAGPPAARGAIMVINNA